MQDASSSGSIPTKSFPVKASSRAKLAVMPMSTSTWSATSRQSNSSLVEASRASVVDRLERRADYPEHDVNDFGAFPPDGDPALAHPGIGSSVMCVYHHHAHEHDVAVRQAARDGSLAFIPGLPHDRRHGESQHSPVPLVSDSGADAVPLRLGDSRYEVAAGRGTGDEEVL